MSSPVATSSPVSACSLTRKPRVALVLAGQQQPRARAVAALQPRLVEERHASSCPDSSATRAETSGFIPRRRTWPARDRAAPRRRPSRPRPSPARRSCARRGGRAGCAPAASPTRLEPELRAPPSPPSRPGSCSGEVQPRRLRVARREAAVVRQRVAAGELGRPHARDSERRRGPSRDSVATAHAFKVRSGNLRGGAHGRRVGQRRGRSRSRTTSAWSPTRSPATRKAASSARSARST